MRIVAYCMQSAAEAARRATGVMPLTCPPLTIQTVPLGELGGADLLYIDLHGEPRADVWRGDGGLPALTAPQARLLDLQGATVFALSCYLGDEYSPMLDALLDAGAHYVIGGLGVNYATAHLPGGATMLAQWYRRLVQAGVPVLLAVTLAKQRVELDARLLELAGRRDQAEQVRDALQFHVYERNPDAR